MRSRFTGIALLLALGSFVSPVSAQVISGQALALDGDTLELTGQRLRLVESDAPELRQTCQRDGAEWACGAQAKDQLATLIAGQDVICEGRRPAPDNALLATCRVGDVYLAEAMVAAGLAVVTPEGEATLAQLQERVKQHRLGIWTGDFDSPDVWRKANPKAGLPPVRAAAARSESGRRKVYRNAFGCAIKGNDSYRQGELIYYLPGMKYYDGTRPEALFCTEEEAQAAGFRRSRGG